MARPADSDDYSDEGTSSGSASEEDPKGAAEANLDEEDEEELEAVGRTASPGEDEAAGGEDNSQSTEDDVIKGSDEEDEVGIGSRGRVVLLSSGLRSVVLARGLGEDSAANTQVAKRERARLKQMQRLKKQKIQEILDAQNAAIDADMNNKGKGRLKYLLQQTEIFAHFAKGAQSASDKKPKGRWVSYDCRGRHASKVTEEEEDEEYLKEEEESLAGAGGGTRLVAQPSCKLSFSLML
ncbi:hypothetical protein Taro_012432 [Colocasia esculenta]|uniref:Uncharacterized protein n=1 Tax=Colocasia esculenta TaxID=4460 RepID=A0A843UCU1_COLES|nr:hypothetical protein [Colocasia esculenta]